MTDTYMLESAINKGCNHIYDLLYAIQIDCLRLFQDSYDKLTEDVKEDSLDTNSEINLSGFITDILELPQAHSASELKRAMILMAIQFNSKCIVRYLLNELPLDENHISDLIIESIDHSAFDSLDCLVKRLEHPNQVIGSTGCNLVTLCCVRGKINMAKHVVTKHLCDFTLTISGKQIDSLDSITREGFLVSIIKADLPESIKFLSVHFAISHGNVSSPEDLSTALDVALSHSPLISNFLILLHMHYDLFLDFNKILLNCVQSRLSLHKKRMILEMISGRFDFEAMEIDDTLRIKIRNVLDV